MMKKNHLLLKSLVLMVLLLIVLVGIFVWAQPTTHHSSTPGLLSKTPTPSFENNTRQVSLGLRVVSTEQVDFFNQYAQPQDTIATGISIKEVGLLKNAKTQNKSLVYGGEASTDEAIAVAKANDIKIIFFNKEGTQSVEELAQAEKEAYKKAKAAGLSFGFAPTGRMLAAHYQSFVLDADIIGYQTQSIQTEANYAETVRNLIVKMKALNPKLQVFVQVSVTPQGDRTITADKVIANIRSIADIADQIKIFSTQQPDRVAVMKEVFKNARSN